MSLWREIVSYVTLTWRADAPFITQKVLPLFSLQPGTNGRRKNQKGSQTMPVVSLDIDRASVFLLLRQLQQEDAESLLPNTDKGRLA